MSSRDVLRWLERAFLAMCLAAAVLSACSWLPSVLARVRSVPPRPATDHGAIIPAGMLSAAYLRRSGSVSDGTKIGSIKVPAIRMDEPVVEGVSTSALRRGVGHVSGTANSGGLGNMVLAAHRDTAFRSLRLIQKGMDVQVTSADGTFHYAVDSTQIVTPDRVDVLGLSSRPDLTLITCYPFNFIGSAPMRFVVKAHLLSAISDEAPQ